MEPRTIGKLAPWDTLEVGCIECDAKITHTGGSKSTLEYNTKHTSAMVKNSQTSTARMLHPSQTNHTFTKDWQNKITAAKQAREIAQQQREGKPASFRSTQKTWHDKLRSYHCNPKMNRQ